VYSPGVVVAPGAAAVVSSGPDIIDIAIVSMFLVMAASAATGVFKGSGEDWEAAGVQRWGFVVITVIAVQQHSLLFSCACML
jgi:hypothetical protein